MIDGKKKNKYKRTRGVNQVIDLLGKTFGKWKVISRAENRYNGSSFWLCKCLCGNEGEVSGANLRNGHSKSCKKCSVRDIFFHSNPKPSIDLSDQIIGEWKVIKRVDNRYGGKAYWLCKCSCGTEKEVSSQTLLNKTSKCCNKCSPRVHTVTHGYCRNKKIPEYLIWRSIKDRCRNPNNKGYRNYGARGIEICDRWFNSFSYFLLDVGKKPFPKASLDRIDNDNGYFLENVRWTTRYIQAGNTRKQPIINGEKICITRLAKEINRCRMWVGRKLKEGILPKDLEKLDGPPYKEYYVQLCQSI